MDSRKLLSYGFKPVGDWKKSKKHKNKVKYTINKLQNERVIYAFVVNNDVKYIGKTDRTLTKRMKSYQNANKEPPPKKESTNKKIIGLINNNLNSKKLVKIFAFKPSTQKVYRHLKIDLVGGLEIPLIKRFKTKKPGKWNSL